MTISEMFQSFISNLAIHNKGQISERYGEITRALNQKYRETESKTANSLQVGSYGRLTGIKGISDLDMIYIMPPSEWDRFKDGRQSALLQEVRNAIKERYPKTDIRGDGQVVVVSFVNFEIEVVPAFENKDGSFKYPNTKGKGSWPTTNPRSEIKAISTMDSEKNSNLRPLCKMIRSWRNKHGLVMGGLLVDTLAFNFLKSTNVYDDKSFQSYDFMARDFLKYASDLTDQEYYLAPGSGQYVYVKKKFQKKAKKAYDLCLKAIESNGNASKHRAWRKVFGGAFPDGGEQTSKAFVTEGISWDDTEQFIENFHPIDIRYSLRLDCAVSQNGFRKQSLLNMLQKHIPLLAKHKLVFQVIGLDVPEPFDLKWKVLNKGKYAKKRNQIRGQIVSDDGSMTKEEPTVFKGPHEVECYAVKNGVVVARGRIDVPIESGE